MNSIKKRVFAFCLAFFVFISVVFMDYVKPRAIIGELIGALGVVVGAIVGAEQIGGEDYETFYRNTLRPNWQTMVSQLLSVIPGVSMSPEMVAFVQDKCPIFAPDPIQELKYWMARKNGTDASNITDDDVYRQLYQMFDNSSVNYDNDSISISSDLNSLINYMVGELEDYSFSYAYSYDLQKSLTTWGASDIEAIAQLFSMFPDKYIEVIRENGILEAGIISTDSNLYAVRYGNTYGYGSQTLIRIYEGKEVNGIRSADVFVGADNSDLTVYEFVNDKWSERSLQYPYSLSGWQLAVAHSPDVGCPIPMQYYGKMVTNKGDRLLYFDSESQLLTYISNVGVGKRPYYINQSVYNDWSQSSGDYTVTTDNSNRVTYGDINNYIDDHHTETGFYPSIPDINIWIESQNPIVNPTPTPEPNNPSGSGSFVNNNNPSITNNPTFNNNPNINITLFPSVSDNNLNGGTVSGNGGQGSIGNIFDWLGNLGNVIASLIKNVGEMIVKALQGVIEAVTTILNGIPNILTPIIEFVFGGLPDELQALISLGITCIIFVGIIKVIKR